MKKIFTVLTVAALMLGTTTAGARNVTEEQAKDAAAHFLAHNTNHERVTAADLRLIHTMYNVELSIPSTYFFNAGDWGWIAIAGTTVMDPIVAFSDLGNIDMSNIAPATSWWFDSYNAMIAEIQTLDDDNGYPDCDEWKVLENHQLKGNTKDQQIVLMQETWDQGDDYGYTYNMYSPTVNGIVCPTGCVATAMAQIIHYYRYPVYDTAKVIYNWSGHYAISYTFNDTFDYSLMPMYLTNNSPLAQRQEVSKLGYACAVSVQMQWDSDGSGTQSTLVPNAMKKNFKYQLGNIISRGNNDTAFIGKIRRDLQKGPNGKGRPVYMSGSSSEGNGVHAGGHAWVVAGYFRDNVDKYFMNWGWGGSGNGFYNLKTNQMSVQGYNFNQGHKAIINMVPPTDSNRLSISKPAVATLGSAYPNPASVSIKVPYNTNMSADMLIYSVDGKVVARRRVQPGNGEVEVNVDAMPSGIYIYRLGDAYGKFVVK